MVRVSLGFMFLACLGIDLIRQVEAAAGLCDCIISHSFQRHIRYKARQIVLVRNIRDKTGQDLRKLNLKDKLSGKLSEKVPL